MNNIILDQQGQRYLFARQKDFAACSKLSSNSELTVKDNKLYCLGQPISNLVPVSQLSETLAQVHRLSLEPERQMPSAGWCFELYKDSEGFLQAEFTKAEWLKKGREYVGVSFAVTSPFTRPGAQTLVSYFQPGGLLEEIAVNIYSRYNRLFTKYGGRPVATQIEQVPELEAFLQDYLPDLYQDLLETATYALLENFDSSSYLEQIIQRHYTYPG